MDEELEVPGGAGYKVRKLGESKAPGCCEFVGILRGAVDDEKEGVKLYNQILENLQDHIPVRDMMKQLHTEVLRNMVEDEKRHVRYLEAIGKALSNLCKCD